MPRAWEPSLGRDHAATSLTHYDRGLDEASVIADELGSI